MLIACSSDTTENIMEEEVIETPNPEPNSRPVPVYTLDNITDTYFNVASEENASQWGLYNVHDPAIINVDGTYYYYNTDVSFGSQVRPGIQIRKSHDFGTI